MKVMVMNSVCRSEEHQPQMAFGVIGLGGFDRHKNKSVFCLIANNDNHFLNEGIVNNSFVFVDKMAAYREGALNVFRQSNNAHPFKLARSQFPGAEYFGRVFLTVNHYGD